MKLPFWKKPPFKSLPDKITKENTYSVIYKGHTMERIGQQCKATIDNTKNAMDILNKDPFIEAMKDIQTDIDDSLT
jgi:hypothetical protein